MHNKLLSIIILVSIIIGASTLTRGHQWGDDFAWYILQAKSIVTGTTDEFMEISDFTNYQSTLHLGPLAYPWGYPLILAPVYALKEIHPLALKLPGLFFYAGFLICLYLFAKDRFTRTESLLLVSLFAFNPLLLRFLDQILSDIPFLFFSMLSFMLMTQEHKRGVSHYALIGASVFFMAFLRVTGALLLGCFLIVEFFKLLKNRKDRAAAIEIIRNSFVTCFVFALLWGLNLLLFPSGGESYFSHYTGLIETARELAPTYFNIFSRFFGEANAWTYLYYFLLIFFLLGAWIRRKKETVLLLFFALWLIVHVTYPYPQLPRYIFPLLPIFICFTFQGMKVLINKLPEGHHQVGQTIFYGFWLFIAGIFLFTSSRSAYVNLRNGRTINGPFDPYSLEVYNYIKEETPPDSVVIFFKPRVMVIMTGHLAIFSTECDRMYKGDYLVLSRKVGENQQITPEDISACNLPLNQVLKNNRFIVYEIQK
ncbi:MAG: glycosyltransferase family 39 protein [Anaerolineales bacterium]|nr:glycosyltransferase family 39 protein [Anaerolineales bacterium]